MTKMFDRITVNPNICMGQATIRGMRITVAFVLRLIASGMKNDEILKSYPELEKEDLQQSIEYAAWLASEYHHVYISPLTVSSLKSGGYNIERITEFLPATASDEEIIKLTIEKDGIIITQDLDFSSIIVQTGLNKPSVISLRIEKPVPDKVTKILLDLIPKVKENLIKGCILSVNEIEYRIRELPISL